LSAHQEEHHGQGENRQGGAHGEIEESDHCQPDLSRIT
jgi:hypothetical protein